MGTGTGYLIGPEEIPDEAVINSMRECGMSDTAIEKVKVALDFVQYLSEDFQEWRDSK